MSTEVPEDVVGPLAKCVAELDDAKRKLRVLRTNHEELRQSHQEQFRYILERCEQLNTAGITIDYPADNHFTVAFEGPKFDSRVDALRYAEQLAEAIGSIGPRS